MFEKFLTILGTICIVLGAGCVLSPSAKFGVLFFFSLGIGCLALTICIKISKSNYKYNKLFKIISIIGKTIFLLWLISFIIIEALIFTGSKSDDEIKFDTIIVLGAGIRGEAPSFALKSRLDEAIEYLDENDETKVIVTGGFGVGEDFSEAHVSKKYLIENDIEEHRILIEDKSRNTFQNVQYSKDILGDDYDGVTAAVSNNFHLFRARMILQQNGLTGYAIGQKIPTYEALNVLYNIREYFSVVKHLLFER